MLASVDGCKTGWVVALSESWPPSGEPYLCVCRDFCTVLKVTGRCAAVVIDIPIGLPSGTEVRLCDSQARDLLGKEGRSRLFLAPPRESFTADSPEEFQKLHTRARGKGAGWPVWGILSRLKEVDAQMSQELQKRVREFHPELTWKRLAGQTLPSKHHKDGIEARIQMLERVLSGLGNVQSWASSLGRAAKSDDLLDAIVGLSAVDCIQREGGSQFRLPSGKSQDDEKCLRMEIWYSIGAHLLEMNSGGPRGHWAGGG